MMKLKYKDYLPFFIDYIKEPVVSNSISVNVLKLTF